jgi:hypothetical protein
MMSLFGTLISCFKFFCKTSCETTHVVNLYVYAHTIDLLCHFSIKFKEGKAGYHSNYAPFVDTHILLQKLWF